MAQAKVKILNENPAQIRAVPSLVPEGIPEQSYNIPHIIKYMGSKKPILNFVTSAIADININNIVCDLFAGSCSVSAALRGRYDFISNDIQAYSAVLAKTYFSDFSKYDSQEIVEDIQLNASIHAHRIQSQFPEYLVDYTSINSVREYGKKENHQRELINQEFNNPEYHLFSKFYSGTYWSFEQCIWIDSIRKTAELYKGTDIYDCVLSSLMYAMAYTSQSTGHFAQYRDGADTDSMQDILVYRNKNLFDLFSRKMSDLMETLKEPTKSLVTSSLDYSECLESVPDHSTVYADPPYAPVHYSRFYHALETIVRYDYPEVRFKARYRTDRHQSPFSKRGTVVTAFTDLFDKIISRNAQMVLSYSNTGVLNIEALIKLAKSSFEGNGYQVTFRTLDYSHSTMGRAEDKKRDVIEYLILAKFK